MFDDIGAGLIGSQLDGIDVLFREPGLPGRLGYEAADLIQTLKICAES